MSAQGEPYVIKAGDTIEFSSVRAPEHTPMTSLGKKSPMTEEGAKRVALILEQMEEKREQKQREKECIEVQQAEARRQAAAAAVERQRRIDAARTSYKEPSRVPRRPPYASSPEHYHRRKGSEIPPEFDHLSGGLYSHDGYGYWDHGTGTYYRYDGSRPARASESKEPVYKRSYNNNSSRYEYGDDYHLGYE